MFKFALYDVHIITDQYKWCCSEECRNLCGTKIDHVQEYTKAVGFRGLIEMCHRDMIREGDGAALNRDWRLMMVDFNNFNHSNYFTISTQLFAGIYNFFL
jgi:hypothetical protein